MTTRLDGYFVFLAALVLLAIVPNHVHANSERYRLIKGLMQEVNVHRALNKVSALNLSTKLSAVAQKHAEDMARGDFFSHISSDGSDLEKRVSKEGYFGGLIAENLFAGTSSPKSVANAWMNSPSHRTNMLNGKFSDAGLGFFSLSGEEKNSRYTHYWVIIFAGHSHKISINKSYRRGG